VIHLWWWLQHITGMDAPGNRPYNFWSGFGSDLAELALIGGLIRTVSLMKHHHREHMTELKKQRNDTIKS
jgi:hypothetical protein